MVSLLARLFPKRLGRKDYAIRLVLIHLLGFALWVLLCKGIAWIIPAGSDTLPVLLPQIYGWCLLSLIAYGSLAIYLPRCYDASVGIDEENGEISSCILWGFIFLLFFLCSHYIMLATFLFIPTKNRQK